ncbi:ATP-binding sensor histidine kinase [Vitiosangium sp. GDMCC 1.1324]|uniref:trifunctional serine/threonine-protein kinase/ATP-binding protein/sensor histidine kinase n=1 Tax=Vitiosangium sp. (strain GDMCC 1.1324) TaxID=2138576 RepID=UPI000D387A35|nr:ATP-binding sensor histidine kinase [Vitiosangium sp. GDMCC 1.1324]PTL80106.1 histidine kinase [Vitiosangium sp. GDMCC 1.1324]
MVGIPGYTLIDRLESTGGSVLYQGVRDADRLPVIVKMPATEHPSARELEHYRREHAILQRLREVRGVTRVVGCELTQGRPVLLLEHEGGVALSQSVGAPLEVDRFLELALSIASTLADIHRRGVIHKDLKPSNIVLLPSGETRIIDFGTATLQGIEHVEAAPASLIEGTLAYMSPEQTGRMNRSVDYRTDLYSLGVTFYELLTGTLPFHGRDALEWFHAHMAQAPKPPHERVPTIPLSLSAIVMKLLAKVAEERYQGADGLKADLLRCREALARDESAPFPLGEHDVPTHFQMPQRLYGREAQVDLLLQAFERVARGGRPELVLISGYSGIGKSSVVHELYRPIVQRRGLFLDGKFDQFQRDIPYATLAQAIRGLVRQLLAGTDAELEAWREQLREAWEGNGQLLVDLVPQLELIVGKQPALPELSPAEVRHRFDRVFQRFLGVLSTPEHPLAIFLDDLQWADRASLRLVQHLFTHPDTPPLLLIGAYRDNEVSPSHPLMLTREELRAAGARVSDLRLEPLSAEQLRQIITDALPGAGPELVEPLSALVHEKTGGNPFFFLQLMRTLNQDGLLTRTPEGSWRWDAEGVRARAYSDNVVDFLVGRLRQLPEATQHLLRLSACAGNAFVLRTLSLISDKPLEEVEQGLEPALQEGLVMRGGEEQYRFLHDRIQQAAHALIPEEERKAVHLRIGRLLLASLPAEEVREKIFDVVNQLNAGAELLQSPEERHHVAMLNAEAGWKAQASTAHRSAIAYFTTALSLLPGDSWEQEPELTFKLSLQRATSEFMSGNLAGAHQLVGALRSRARTPSQLAAVSRLRCDIHLTKGETPTAVTCLLECLASLGMPMSPHPTWAEVEAANAELWALLGERPIASLLELPLMTDPDRKAVMSVLDTLFMPAFLTDNNLLVLHLSRMLLLTLRHGNSEAATQGYARYGIVLVSFFKRHQEGHAFGELALALIERHGFSASRARVLYAMERLSIWTRPLALALEYVRSAFQHAVPAGDFQTACYSCPSIVMARLALGHGLEEVYQESIARLDFARKTGYRAVQHSIHHTQRYVQQLRGLSRTFDSLNGEDFEEEAFEAGLASAPHVGTMGCWYWITKMRSRFMCGRYEEARQASLRAAELLWSSAGYIQLVDFHLYSALTLSACCEDATPEMRREYLEALERHRQQLEEWAVQCPGNFRAAERLVSAELAYRLGGWDDAMHTYEEALRSARENGFIQHVALVSELAARFWRKRSVSTIALAYAREAREAYRTWGAHGKVRQLDDQWPFPSGVAKGPDRGACDTTSTQIDALTVVKAQQAISGEIVMERLASTLLQVAIENAGAQRGALLRPLGNKLQLVALSQETEGGTVVLPDENVPHALPWSLLTYVKRAHEHVLIGDASKPHPYSSDGYFARGQARSVLCLPLMRQEELVGVLYLENSLAADAFTPARIALLGHIASQAAISLENARLYADIQRAKAALREANDELERRVDERTHELKEAQARLVEMARAAGMSEIASNVLHNVGNVLTSAVVNLETMRHGVGASRVTRVRQVAGLLEEHRARLADFFTADPRGTCLPDYLAALGAELITEQTNLQESLEAMSRHVEHIRAIVHVQQTYAKTPLLTEECDLGQLVDDTLRIQYAALQRHGISVTREVGFLPRVRLDKHKVMQILINLLANAKNAMDAMPEEQRRLLVRLTSENGWARIQVVDSGAGIAPEVLGKLFSHGFTTRRDGHGFGLHWSALAAQMLGGRLTLQSEGPGRGATATLEIPLAPKRPE